MIRIKWQVERQRHDILDIQILLKKPTFSFIENITSRNIAIVSKALTY